ncbi:hypothetical protein [Acetobacterium woodii]|uniref:Uncharacterized protein n=1 Tax=Acetobacterium woodii (strain ATCC 29683 / DSM 1030 / JCM 2381 / KCTC 1655 / WB1) TaxID=931626 RepID=H6LDT4_ACEWD|nr:hypothetical protein [Acetobacterium woodii]AFA49248.1 hypothetical protein Awo_c24910 [Acetobacterium woodii DSM 1030]
MKLKLQQEVYEFLNRADEIDNLFNLINNKMNEEHLQLSYLIIDEIPIYQKYYEYFEKNIDTIEMVEVICNQLKGLVDETLSSAYNYMKNAIAKIKSLSEEFYKNPKAETWSDLADMFEGVLWIIDTQSRIDQIKNLKEIINDYSLWNEYVQLVKKMMAILPDLEVAMNNHDNVLIGDLLLYEMLPFVEESVEKIGFLIPDEGVDYVS